MQGRHTSISEQTNDLPQSSRPIIVLLPQTQRELQPDFLFLGVFFRNMFQLPCRPYFLVLAEVEHTESNDKKFSGSSTQKVHTDTSFTNLSFTCFRDLTKSWADAQEIPWFFQESKIQVQMQTIPSSWVVDVKPGALANLPCEYVRKSFVLLQSLTLCEAWWLRICQLNHVLRMQCSMQSTMRIS